MRFESQTPPPPQDDHVDRITDCSTRYGQAPAVCTRVRLARGKWKHWTSSVCLTLITPIQIADHVDGVSQNNKHTFLPGAD